MSRGRIRGTTRAVLISAVMVGFLIGCAQEAPEPRIAVIKRLAVDRFDDPIADRSVPQSTPGLAVRTTPVSESDPPITETASNVESAVPGSQPKALETPPPADAGSAEAPLPTSSVAEPVAVALAATAAPEASELPKPDEGFGHIVGRVVWDGPSPQVAEINIPADHPDLKACAASGHKLVNEDIVIDESNGGLRNVYIYLKAKPATFHPSYPRTDAEVAARDEALFSEANAGATFATIADRVKGNLEAIQRLQAPVTLDQWECRYEPRALAMRQGQTLLVKNPDPVNHNVNCSGFSNSFNLNMTPLTVLIAPALKTERTVILVKCNAHAWMTMSLMVFDHPYFDVTGPDGSFALTNVPAGAVELVVRNPTGKYIDKGKALEVPSGGVLDLGEIRWSEAK